MISQKLLREQTLKKRAQMPFSNVLEFSKIITKKVLDLAVVKRSKNFFVYNSFKNEVQTGDIIENLKSAGKVVSCPLVDGSIMHAVLPTSNDFILDKFGVKTPKNYVLANDIEVAIIPLIACDKFKNRVGFGKGYYDKFLKDKTIYKIGICYDFQVIDSFLVNEWDVPLDIIITETQIIE